MPKQTSRKQLRVKLFIFLLLIVSFVTLLKSDFNQYINLDFLLDQKENIANFINQHYAISIVLFSIIYTVAVIFSLPISAILTLSGGYFFGFITGSIIVLLSAAIASCIPFILARYLMKDYLQSKFKKSFDTINKKVEQYGTMYLLFVRILPIFPFGMINIIFSFTNIRLKQYYILTQIGIIPGTILYINAGRELSKITATKDILNLSLFLAFLALALLPVFLKYVFTAYKNYKMYSLYKKPKKFDVENIVIGGGASGLVAAYVSAFLNMDVILIEKKEMGGECLNLGCVPSKALLHVAKLFEDLNTNKTLLGLENSSSKIDGKAIFNRVREKIAAIAPHDSIERYVNELGVKEIIKGKANIKSPYIIEVNGRQITTKNIIIAIGGKPKIPTLPGLELLNKKKILTYENFWTLDDLPKKITFIGGGVISCELGYALSTLGVDVSIIHNKNRLLLLSEPEASLEVEIALEKAGVSIIKNAIIEKFENFKTMIYKIEDTQYSHSFEHIFFSISKEITTNTISSELTFQSENNKFKVNEFLQTNYKNIFAVGDCSSSYQLTPVAGYEGGIAASNTAFGFLKKLKPNYKVIPNVVYTSPEIAQVGLTEAQLKEQDIEYHAIFKKISEIDRAIVTDEENGFIKILTNKQNKILGCTIASSRAGEMIAEFSLGMSTNITLNKIFNTMHPYPTYSELGKNAIGDYKKEHLSSQIVKIFIFLKKIRNLF